MSLYIQYHNYDREGLLLGNAGDDLGIHTRLSHVQNAVGGRVFIILGIGSPRQYYLWCSFTVSEVESLVDGEDKPAYHAFGPGWRLVPPQRLEGPEFETFKKSCANFVGFRKVDDLPFSKTLVRLADQHQAGSVSAIRGFVDEFQELLGDDEERQQLADYFAEPVEQSAKHPSEGKKQPTAEAQPRMKALSIRQPHAEAIMRGIKDTEYRSGPTKIRGRIFIYAGLGRYSADDESVMLDEYGLSEIDSDELPRGVLVGTVELFDCDGVEWYLRNPERADQLLAPKNHPQPVWFHPF
jgi:hypothetical protein